MDLITVLTFISGISFLFFGIACFTTAKMKSEFKRYGLGNFRTPVGALQLLGASGLLLGYFCSPLLQLISAFGLSILMLLGFMVRLKIRDPFLQSVPSLGYAILNAMLFALLYPTVLTV